MVLMRLEDLSGKRNHFLTILSHLDKGSHEDSLASRTALWKLLLDHVELSGEALTLVVCNQVPKL